jgi:hypothetical protein
MTECNICYDDFTLESRCMYKTRLNTEWVPFNWCIDCVRHMINTQYQAWIESVKNATCPKALQRLIDQGPPIWLYDATTFPVQPDDYVIEIGYNNPVVSISAKLTGAVEGDAREHVWNEMKAIMYQKAQEINKNN